MTNNDKKYLFILFIILTILGIFIHYIFFNVYLEKEINEKEYNDIFKLNNNIKSSLLEMKMKNTKIIGLYIGNNGYLSFPLEFKTIANKEQLLHLSNLIKNSMKDQKITETEFAHIGAYLYELVKIEKEINLTNLKNSIQ